MWLPRSSWHPLCLGWSVFAGPMEDVFFKPWWRLGIPHDLPSGKHTYKKLWKITFFNGKTHYKWQFSIANCKRLPEGIFLNGMILQWNPMPHGHLKNTYGICPWHPEIKNTASLQLDSIPRWLIAPQCIKWPRWTAAIRPGRNGSCKVARGNNNDWLVAIFNGKIMENLLWMDHF